PQNTIRAVERACELVELLGCGEVVGGVIDVLPKALPETVLPLEPEKINALLGTQVSAGEMERILLALGFCVEDGKVAVPSWRADVEGMADLAEEVARFYGYDNIPMTLLRGDTTNGGYNEMQKAEITAGQACRALGYDEIITYSFISPSAYDKIRWPEGDPRRDSLRILNPLGEDSSIMRTSILPSMMDILSRNYHYRNASVKLYELGKVYFKRPDGLADEPKVLALGSYGGGSFFALKGAVETVLDALRVPGARFLAEPSNPSYHPGRCAKVLIGDAEVGVLGQIHPLVAQNYGIDAEVYCAEMRFDRLYALRGDTPVYAPLPRFPAVTRDLSLVVEEKVTVGELAEAIRAHGGQYLESARYVGVYRGAPILPGFKSVTFSLGLRAEDQTLTVEHADEAIAALLRGLEQAVGAVIR
ncbi:MAG: phenylalanine--tRNA ligase subunit beta, partial [Oscillospiraceae bacterium]|nr:phenylalanine--tRNA ligase subunit beta [Oscillospiraceae bacterium]